MSEIWDLVDKDGRDSGIKWHRSDHDIIPEGLYHLCVEVWVKVGDRLLLSRRHPDKTEGLKLDCPGGAVISGESVISAALRELREEVGIEAGEEQLTLLGRLALGRAYAFSYMLSLDEMPKIVLQPSEVVGYCLVAKEELDEIFEELTRGTKKRYQLYKNSIFSE